MEDILIESHNLIREKTFKKILVILFSVAAVLGILLLFLQPMYEDYGYENGYEAAFSGEGWCLLLFILQCVVIVSGVIVLICFFANKNRKLVITDTEVIAIKPFGREIILPLHMISSVSTVRIFSGIRISTPSESVRFNFLLNYMLISCALARRLAIRQLKTQPMQNESQEYEFFLENLPETDDELL
ncbi:MAG: hypothetical protein E7607_07335 [Ruminococcaceae bacterium]|nr:hypothetical protein [Oscillospiraceae bacterium]